MHLQQTEMLWNMYDKWKDALTTTFLHHYPQYQLFCPRAVGLSLLSFTLVVKVYVGQIGAGLLAMCEAFVQ